MEKTLLSMETAVFEIRLDNDTLRVTDKRLIHNDRFIGIHELRGAIVTLKAVTVNNSKVHGYEVTKSWTILLLTIAFCIVGYIMMHPYNFGGYFAVISVSLIGAVLFGSLIAAPVHFLLKARTAISSETRDMVLLTVEKTDNSYFINNYYNPEQIEQLKRFESEINAQIFK
jgi:hypothetical protein